MSSNRYIQYLAGLIVAALLLFLFFQSRIDSRTHEQTITQLLALIELDSRLKYQVTSLQTGYHLNYGGLSATKIQIRHILGDFDHDDSTTYLSHYPDIAPLFEELSGAYHTKLKLIEEVKQNIAIYRNSLHHLPRIISQFNQQIAQSTSISPLERSQIISRLNHLESHLFRFNAQIITDRDQLNAFMQQQRKQLSTLLPYTQIPRIDRIYQHTELIINLSEKLSNQFDIILSNNTTELSQQLYQQYQQLIAEQKRNANTYQIWLLVLSLALLIYLAYIFFKFQKTSTDLTRTLNDLEFQKYAIDQHAIVSITDLSGNIIYANELFCKISKYDAHELIGKNHNIIKSGFHERAFFNRMWSTITSGHKWHGTIANRAKDGSIYWVDSTIIPRLDHNGKPYQFIGIRTDITLQKNAEHEINLLARFPSENPDPVLRISGDGELLYANAASAAILHYWNVDYGDFIPDQWIKITQKVLFDNQEEEHEIKITDQFYSLRFSPVFHENYVNLYGRNITEIKDAQHNLNYQATHDPLTNLSNRLAFELELESTLQHAQYNEQTSVLLYIDLDQFKIVNDTCGHVAGDELLRQISVVFSSIVRDSDTLARLGGDEFGVILHKCDIEHGTTISDKILNTIQGFRFLWQDKSFEIGASIGMVSISPESDSASNLLSQADIACYAAKDAGRNQVQLYQSNYEMEKRQDEMLWASRIPTALANDQFILYAQRIKSITDEYSHSHYEILIRLQDESGELVPPGAFIPAAERYGIMSSMDMWVITTSLEMLGIHNQRHPESPITISINLSGQSIGNDQLLKFVPDLIEKHQIDPSFITFEITETSAIANLSSAMTFIQELKKLGCKFSLDDFGSGLSSFAYLKNMPVDFLKIDGYFVKDILDDPIDAAMVDSINQIGHVMNIKTIAEFVENQAIEDQLRILKVDFAQGYGIEKPMPFIDILQQASQAPKPDKPRFLQHFDDKNKDD